MRILGSEITGNARVVEVPIGELKLDPNNVRFQHLEVKLTDKQIHGYIWGEPDTKELYDQILAAKGLYEEPVIDEEKVVREGNRRVVCLRVLKQKAHNKELPKTIPANQFDKIKCKILPTDADPAAIDLFLAAIHVKGKKEWNTFNRAKHIYNLHSVHRLSYDTIARHLGMAKITVMRMVDVYKATEEYGKKHPEDEAWYHKFTYYDELYKKRDLKDWRKDPSNVVKFGEWVNTKKFRDVRDVRDLPKIVQDTTAVETLERTNIVEAKKVVEAKDPTIKSPEFKRLKDAIETIRSFSRKELIRTMNDESRMELLKALRKEIEALLEDLESMKKSTLEVILEKS